MNRRTFIGKGLRAALAAVIGGSAAIALNEQAEAGVYCTWVRKFWYCSGGNTYEMICRRCRDSTTGASWWVQGTCSGSYYRAGCVGI